ncbi:MAG TPA: hypothetical protein VF139_07380 [Candidatus Polarisedimenticolaceae bacterium]
MRSSPLPIVRAALAALLLLSPALAQDEPSSGSAEADAASLEVKRPYKLWAQWEQWYVQPIGLEMNIVTEIDPFATSALYRGRTLPTPFGTDGATRWRGGVTLPNDAGEAVLTYWATQNRFERTEARPGQFVFGTNLAYPAFAGILDDSLADGYAALVDVGTRDLRIEYQRAVVTSPRIQAIWSVGGRWVDAHLTTEASYQALAAPIPAFYDPPANVELAQVLPIPDRVRMDSRFSGRGLSTGLEARMPFFKDRFTVEASVNVSVLRGDKESNYNSITSAYIWNSDNGLIYLDKDLLLDPTITGDAAILQRIFQSEFPVYASDPGSSGSAFVYEAGLGFRARVWKTLEVTGGFRTARYDDILDELRPADLTVVGTVVVPGIQRSSRSLTYEGFYFGACFTY